ncbi:MAG TPA: 50S ribosomal protein L9 [Nitrospiria bacterium]|nr:50S ribosomal protein L9 [Nitrospiria bacterium]
MKVILRENVEHLGKMGDLVEVKNGYARNYLIPKNKAFEATVGSIRVLEHQKRLIADQMKKEKKAAEELAQKISSFSVTIPVQVGEEEKLFGSVTSKDIAEALAAQGLEIDRKQIVLEKPIKELGIFDVPVKIQHDVQAQVKVTVTKAD